MRSLEEEHIIVDSDDLEVLHNRVSIHGLLEVRGAGMEFPQLKSVGGLRVTETATACSFPKLDHIARFVMVHAPRVELPSLRNIAGVDISSRDEAAQHALLSRVAEAVFANPEAMNMHLTHNADRTVHDLAGWGVHLGGAAAHEVEKATGDTYGIASLLMGPEATRLFYASEAQVMAFLLNYLPAERQAEARGGVPSVWSNGRFSVGVGQPGTVAITKHSAPAPHTVMMDGDRFDGMLDAMVAAHQARGGAQV